jgi:hypothetical protein
MSIFKAAGLSAATIIFATVGIIHSSPAQADDAANYARYVRYSKAVGDWWYYHPGVFSGSGQWLPRRTWYRHSHYWVRGVFPCAPAYYCSHWH